MQQAGESTDAASLGKKPLDPYFEADASAAAAAGKANVVGRMHLTFDPVQFPGDSTHTVSANDSLAGQFHMPQYSLSKAKLAALAADGWARVGIRFERLYRTEHFSGSTTTTTSAVSGQGFNRFIIGFSRTTVAGVPGQNTYSNTEGGPQEAGTSGMPEFGFHIFDNVGSSGQIRFYRYLKSVSPSSSLTPGPQTCVQDGSDGNALKGIFEMSVSTTSPFNVQFRGPRPGASGPTQYTWQPLLADLYADSGFADGDTVVVDGAHYGCGSWLRNVGWMLENADGWKVYQTPTS